MERTKDQVPAAITKAYADLCAAIERLGAKAEYAKPSFYVNGISLDVRIETEWTGYAWHMQPSTKLRCKYTEYHNGKQWPEIKHGGFFYNKIAEFLVERARVKQVDLESRAKIEAKSKDALPIARQINHELGLLCNYGTRADVDRKGELVVTIHERCTEEQARKILSFVKETVKETPNGEA